MYIDAINLALESLPLAVKARYIDYEFFFH
jgi:hypothetical protein